MLAPNVVERAIAGCRGGGAGKSSEVEVWWSSAPCEQTFKWCRSQESSLTCAEKQFCRSEASVEAV